MDNTNPNTFILKRYLTKDAEDHYKREVNGYWNLKHPESIIGFYGSYTHGDDYNILLEFADKGSLEEYFQRETPPSRGGDLIKFWDGLFQLIKALKAIHSNLGYSATLNFDSFSY
jgi:serine/threonine protein kinase